MEDDVLGIRATIDASEVQKGANDFVKAIQTMSKVSDDEVNKMADGYGFLMEQINQLSEAVDAARSKLTSISGAMANVAPKDAGDAQAYEELKAQVDALTQVNDGLKAKLNEATANIAEQAKTAESATGAMRELDAASQSMGNNNIASTSAKTKSEMKQLADGIAFLTNQIKLANQEYQELAKSLDKLQQKKQDTSKLNIRAEFFADSETGKVQKTSKESAMQEIDTQIAQTQAKMTSLKGVIAQNRDEISNCSQRMSELGNQTTQTATKSVSLRTELRNARQHVSEMILAGQQNTVEFGKAVNEANKLQAAFAKASMAINGKNLAFNSFNMMSTAINGVTGALTTYMGVASLFTNDQEKLAKIQKDLQSVMSVSMGVQQLMSAATQISVKWDTLKASALAAVTAAETENSVAQGANATTSAAGTVVAAAQTTANWTLAASFKAVSIAIKQIPVIGWIIAAITALIAAGVALYNWFTKLTPAEEAARDANKAFDDQLKKNRETMLNQANDIGKTIVKYKQLRNQYMEVRNDAKKLDEFIQDNQNSFDDLGVAVNNATDAEKVFNTMSDIVIEGFQLRAQAAAQAQVAIENYTEAYRLQLQAEGWKNSAKYGHSRHSKEDQAKALAKARAMEETADRLTKQGDQAIRDSQATEKAYQQKMQGVPLANGKKTTKKTGKGTGGHSGGGHTGTPDKSQAEINYENEVKWQELNLKMAEKYNDVINQLAQERLANYENNAEKELAQIARETNEKKLAIKKEIDELAKAYKDTKKETWINSGKGRNEYKWSLTTEGKKDDQYWIDELFKRYPKLSEQYDSLYETIEQGATKQEDAVVDKILAQYEKNENQSKKEQLGKYDSEIRVLQNKLLGETDVFKKKEIQQTIEILNNQKDWLLKSKDYWNQYYQKYGTFLEKRAALDEKFAHDTQGLDVNSVEYKTKFKEYKASKSALSTNELKSNIDWSSVFSDIGMMSGKMARAQLGQLQSYTKTDEFNGLNASDQKTITDAISKLQQQVSPYILGAFKNFGKAVDNYKTALNELSALKEQEVAAYDVVTQAKQREAEAAENLAKAQGKLTSAIESGDNAEIKSAQTQVQAQQQVLDAAKAAVKNAQATARQSSEAVAQQSNAVQNAQEEVKKNGKNLSSSFSMITSTVQSLKSGSLSGVFNSIVGLVDSFHNLGKASDKSAKQQKDAANKNSVTADQSQQAQSQMSNAISAAGQVMQQIPNAWAKAIGAVLSVLDILGDDLEGGIGNLIGTLLEKIGNIIETLLSQIGSGKFFTDIGKGIWNLVGGIGRGFGDAFGIRDNWNDYRKASEKYEKLDKVWTSLISKKKEYLSLSYGKEAEQVGKEYVELAQADLDATKAIANRYLGAWKKGSHSAGYNFNKDMGEGVKGVHWSDVSSVVGVNINDITQLTDLSYKQLEALKKKYTEWWVELPEQYRTYLDSIIEKQGTLEDAQDALLEKITGVKFDDMYSNFMSALSDMSKGADDWVSDFKKKMRSAIIQNVMGDDVKKWMEDYTNRYQTAMKAGNGTLSEAQKQSFIDEANEMSDRFFEKRQQTMENLGLASTTEETSEKSGYATASEESIEELSGRALATNEALYSIRDQQLLDSSTLTELGTTLQNLVVIENNRSAYYDESIDIQRTSVSHLAAIEKNTHELFAVNQMLLKIEKNTRNM